MFLVVDYIEEFKSMCKTIKIFDCKSPKEIEEAYHFANNNKGVYIINEYPEKYNDYGILNIICDESSDYSNTDKIQNIFGEGLNEQENNPILCNVPELEELELLEVTKNSDL